MNLSRYAPYAVKLSISFLFVASAGYFISSALGYLPNDRSLRAIGFSLPHIEKTTFDSLALGRLIPTDQNFETMTTRPSNFELKGLLMVGDHLSAIFRVNNEDRIFREGDSVTPDTFITNINMHGVVLNAAGNIQTLYLQTESLSLTEIAEEMIDRNDAIIFSDLTFNPRFSGERIIGFFYQGGPDARAVNFLEGIGIDEGTTVLEINGQRLTSYERLEEALDALDQGERQSIMIERNGVTSALSLDGPAL
jgi:type II secretory pathway component PulC